MAWFKDGQPLEQIGPGIWRDRNGVVIPFPQLVAKGAVPDDESLGQAREQGYQGQPTSINQTASAYAEADLSGPDAEAAFRNLNAPASILGDIDTRMASAYGTYGKALGAADELSAFSKDVNASPYAQALLDQEKLQEQKQRNELGQMYGTNIGSTLRTLGSTGGYDSGARERALQEAGRGLMTGGQNIGATSAYNRLGIRAEDLGTKRSAFMNMPTTYSGLATTGANLQSPYINQMGVEQGYGYNTEKYNIDKSLEKLKLKKNIEASARESYLS